MSESVIMRQVMLALSSMGTTIFRQNVGQGVVGRIMWIRKPQSILVNAGDAVVRGARVFHAGLCPGSSDLVGWRSVVVTEEMVGRRLAVFTAIETKDPRGRTSPEQQNFIDRLNMAGGIGGVAYSPEEAVARVQRGPGV
jgi:hypothetical protein